MPQMKPMLWLLLIFYFLLMYLFMNNMLYFLFFKNKILKENNDIKNLKIKKFNFKW